MIYNWNKPCDNGQFLGCADVVDANGYMSHRVLELDTDTGKCRQMRVPLEMDIDGDLIEDVVYLDLPVTVQFHGVPMASSLHLPGQER